MAGEEPSDDYVVDLLKKDAKIASEQYKFVGLDAFLPKRATTRAPKPNTGFLRNIIKQTDSHNAALLAKEAEESRARLRKLDRAKQREDRGPGRLTPPDLSDDESKPRKRRRSYRSADERDAEEGQRTKSHRREHRHHRDSKSRKDRDDERHGDSDRRRERTRHRDRSEDDDKRPGRSRRDYDEERRNRNSSAGREDHSKYKESSNRKHRRRSYSRSNSRSRSPRRDSRSRHKSSRRKHDDRSRSVSPRREHARSEKERVKSRKLPPAPASDSDPLEAIVGPYLPDRGPPIRSRGRGANKANSMAMDARFSAAYDPSNEARLESDVDDDWGDALETLKDRERWKRLGAERLKEAGFTETQVRKWEKGEEKDEDDVVWSREGQTREWDRGKVVDEDGDVKLKPEWGRLT